MRKIVLSLLFPIVFYGLTYSQTQAQLSQYMFNQSAFNPAYAGESGMIQVTGHHRMQWVGFPNAGNTTEFTINSPFSTGKRLHGAGLHFRNDKAGQYYYQAAHLQYAYKIKFETSSLSVGGEVGFINAGFNSDSIRLTETDFHEKTDKLLQTGNTVGMGFDMSLGVFYSAPNYYAGLSYVSLNQPKVYWNDSRDDYRMSGVLYLTGGYLWKMYNPKFILKPTMLYKTDILRLATSQIDFSIQLEYDKKFWGGLGYRLQDAILFSAGLNIASGLSCCYSFDIPINRFGSWGSHELTVAYEFEYVFGKKKNKYKSIRIL